MNPRRDRSPLPDKSHPRLGPVATREDKRDTRTSPRETRAARRAAPVTPAAAQVHAPIREDWLRRTPEEAHMPLRTGQPIKPTSWQLQEHGRIFPPNHLHDTWHDFLYWDVELEAGS